MNKSNTNDQAPVQQPPQMVSRSLHWVLPESLKEPLMGDLEEEFHQRLASHSPAQVNYWYRKQALRSGLPFLFQTKQGLLMFVFSLIVFTALTLMAMMFAGGVDMFIDIPSFLLIFPPAIAFGIAATSWQDVKQGASMVFSEDISQQPLQYTRAKRAFSVIGNAGVILGVFMSLLGWVAMADNIAADDFARNFGPAFAVSVLTLVYGLGLKMLCYVTEMKIQTLSETENA